MRVYSHLKLQPPILEQHGLNIHDCTLGMLNWSHFFAKWSKDETGWGSDDFDFHQFRCLSGRLGVKVSPNLEFDGDFSLGVWRDYERLLGGFSSGFTFDCSALKYYGTLCQNFLFKKLRNHEMNGRFQFCVNVRSCQAVVQIKKKLWLLIV